MYIHKYMGYRRFRLPLYIRCSSPVFRRSSFSKNLSVKKRGRAGSYNINKTSANILYGAR